MKKLGYISLAFVFLFSSKILAQNDVSSVNELMHLSPRLELPKIVAQKDSVEVAIDTVRHD